MLACVRPRRTRRANDPSASPLPPVWLSFVLRDSSTLGSGEPWSEAVKVAEACAQVRWHGGPPTISGSRSTRLPQVHAVGVNCCDPRIVADCLRLARQVRSARCRRCAALPAATLIPVAAHSQAPGRLPEPRRAVDPRKYDVGLDIRRPGGRCVRDPGPGMDSVRGWTTRPAACGHSYRRAPAVWGRGSWAGAVARLRAPLHASRERWSGTLARRSERTVLKLSSAKIRARHGGRADSASLRRRVLGGG